MSQLKPNNDDTLDLDEVTPSSRKSAYPYADELDPVNLSTNPKLCKEFNSVWSNAFNSAVAAIPTSKGLATAANIGRAKELTKELSYCRIFANMVLTDYMDNYGEKDTIVEGFFLSEDR